MLGNGMSNVITYNIKDRIICLDADLNVFVVLFKITRINIISANRRTQCLFSERPHQLPMDSSFEDSVYCYYLPIYSVWYTLYTFFWVLYFVKVCSWPCLILEHAKGCFDSCCKVTAFNFILFLFLKIAFCIGLLCYWTFFFAATLLSKNILLYTWASQGLLRFLL